MTQLHTGRKWLVFWLLLAVLLIALDQISKYFILQNFQLGEYLPVTSFFNIVRAHNTGAAFSFLAGAGGWQRWFFTVLALIVCLFIGRFLYTHSHKKCFALSLSLILAGALGNVIDRMAHGYVVDFLDFHWAFLEPLFYMGHFPAFNLADAAITCGAIGLVLDEILRLLQGRKQACAQPRA